MSHGGIHVLLVEAAVAGAELGEGSVLRPGSAAVLRLEERRERPSVEHDRD
jgi:hypothetical protein